MSDFTAEHSARYNALDYALRNAVAETPADKLVADANTFLDFLLGNDRDKPDNAFLEADAAKDKPARKPRAVKENPTSETSTTASSASAAASSLEEQPTQDAPAAEPEPIQTGDDLLGEPERVIDVSEVNAAVLAACAPTGIGRDRVVALLKEHGSSGGVPNLPKANYGAFLDALAAQ